MSDRFEPRFGPRAEQFISDGLNPGLNPGFRVSGAGGILQGDQRPWLKGVGFDIS